MLASVRSRPVIAALLLSATLLTGCQVDELADPYYTISENKAETPLSADTKSLIRSKGMSLNAPIMVRIIKEEDKLEVWKEMPNGRYAHLKDYEICAWSGEFGRKKKEGDRQAPEGFYHITPALMNPYSSYFLAFNTGFPNAYDRAHGFTGSHLMVHGACSSRGCYSMTDEQIGEIYALARDAFAGGQKAFQLQAIPFRLTPENLAKHHDHPEFDFWLNLKEGMDHFEVTKTPPAVGVCDRRYVYNVELSEGDRLSARDACPAYRHAPALASGLRSIDKVDEPKLAKLIDRAERREARESARAKRQKALENALSFGRANQQVQQDPQLADISPETSAESSGSARPASHSGSENGASVASLNGLPMPRPRPGSTPVSAETPEQNKGLGLGKFFGRFGFGKNKSDAPVATETTEPANPNVDAAATIAANR